MEIKITDDYRITSDKYNVTIEKYTGDNKEGKEIWVSESHHKTVELALDSFATKRIRQSTATKFAELKADIESLKELMNGIYKELKING